MKKPALIATVLGAAGACTLIFVGHQGREQEPAPTPVEEAVPSPLATRPAPPAPEPTPDPVVEATVASTPAPPYDGEPWAAGVRLFREGNHEAAAVALEDAVAEREDSAYRHYLLGLCYLRLDDPEGAVEEIQRSIELDGSPVRAWTNLARAHLALAELDLARAAVDEALARQLDHAPAWLQLGRVELGYGQLEEAAAAFSRATDHDPQLKWAWNNLGYVRLLQGRHDDAARALLEATAGGEGPVVAFNNLGLALEQLGRPDEAATVLDHAVARGSEPARESLDRLESQLLARHGEWEPGELAVVLEGLRSSFATADSVPGDPEVELATAP